MTVYAALDPLRDSRHRSAAAARDQADWLQYLELGNKAARTLDTYERYTAALLRAYPDKPFGEFTDGDLGHVLTEFPRKSRHIVKACWNNWFRWGYKTRRIQGNPVDLLPEIKYRPDRAYDLFSPAEVEALCSLPAPDGQLMTILFWTGIRRAEARNLTVKRIDLVREDPQMLVHEGTKGSKPRIVPVIPRVAGAVRDLVVLDGLQPDEYLWQSWRNAKRPHRTTPVSNTFFQNWWQRSLDDAGVRARKPHMSRHTFATRMREAGLEMEQIQQLLGHESIRTTSDTYVHSNMSALGDLMRELLV